MESRRHRKLSIYGKIDLVILTIALIIFVTNGNFEIGDIFNVFVIYDKFGNHDGVSYTFAFAAFWAVLINRLLGVVNPRWRQPLWDD